MRCEAGGRSDAVAARPSPAGQVRILQTPLNPALFALVDFVPEAEGGFGDVSSVARAGAAASRCSGPSRWSFESAAGVVGVRRTVAANSVGGNGRGGERRIAGLYGSSHRAGLLANIAATWDGRSIDDFDAGVSGVRGASGVLSAVVEIQVPLGRGVVFDPGQVGQALDRSDGAIGTGSSVRQLRGAVAPNAVADEDLSADVELLGIELQFGAGTEATGKARIIVGEGSARGCGAISGRPARWAWLASGNSWLWCPPRSKDKCGCGSQKRFRRLHSDQSRDRPLTSR